MDINNILTRSEVPEEYTWKTSDIFESDEAFLAALADMKDKSNKLARFREEGLNSAQKLLAFFKELEAIYPLWSNVYNYANLCSDVDTANTTYLDYKSRVMSAAAEFDSNLSYVNPQITVIPDATMEAFYAEAPDLLVYKRYIDDVRRSAAHTLSENEEYILALASEVNAAPEDIFGNFTYADLTFDDIEHEGKKLPLTNSSYMLYIENTDRELRKKAFETLYTRYQSFGNTYAALLSSQVKSLAFKAKARKYASALEASLDAPNVNPEVYHNLIKTVRNNLHLMHRYVALRKKALGVDELHMYDIYAPLVADSTKKISFEEARENVLAFTEIYGKDYHEILKSGFDNRWIDIYENKGKRGGAYSCGAQIHPFVLLNQKDTLDSEFTLAHEMGHAMHSYLSNKYQRPLDSDYSLFVAEVASTCNESLLMQYLLKKTTDRKERAALINHFLEQFKGTLYRQTMFAEFELRINEMYANGEALTVETLCNEYLKLNQEYFGPEMISDPLIACEWMKIPHFYYNFYVYQYATGYSAAIALSNKMLAEGEPAVKQYLNFLQSGCTKDPVSLLRDAGVDMATPKPIEDALSLFASLIDEMEKLL